MAGDAIHYKYSLTNSLNVLPKGHYHEPWADDDFGGVFCVVTLAILSANKMILENTKYYLEEETIEQASNFGNALIAEILTKKFDSKVTTDGSCNITGPYNSSNLPWPVIPTLFDPPSDMGTSAATENNVMPGGNPDVVAYKSIQGSKTLRTAREQFGQQLNLPERRKSIASNIISEFLPISLELAPCLDFSGRSLE